MGREKKKGKVSENPIKVYLCLIFDFCFSVSSYKSKCSKVNAWAEMKNLRREGSYGKNKKETLSRRNEQSSPGKGVQFLKSP